MFERVRQSLNQIEETLRRQFNLAGEIGASLDPIVKPILIAGDLRDPGHHSHQGRCFVFASNVSTGAGVTVFPVLFGADVLIEALYCDTAAAVDFSFYVTIPGETIPLAVSAPAGAWRDRRLAADVPPMSQPGAWGALTGTAIAAGNTVANFRGAGTAPYRAMSLMIPAGGTLTGRATAAGAAGFGFWGRIWP